MVNPVTNPLEAAALLAELEMEMAQSGAHTKSNPKESKGNPRVDRNSLGRPSFEDHAEVINAGPVEGPPEQSVSPEWPDMDEVESVLSSGTGDLSGSDLRTVLRGIVRYQQHLAGYVEANLMEVSSSIDSLTRKVEFLGVPSVLKAPLAVERERVTFSNPKSVLASYFITGSTPITPKACRVKLTEIATSTPGNWLSVGEINSLDPSVLEYLRTHWNEGSVKAKISAQSDRSQ